MKKLLFCLLSSLMTLTAIAQSPEEVLQVACRVNDYFMGQWPDPTKATFVKRERPSSLWTRGVYYEGLMALQTVDPQQRYLDYVDRWADFHQWTPRNGTSTLNADDQCCAQTYLERYLTMGDEKMIQHVKENLHHQMSGNRVDYWTWIDAIQMGMPVYSHMYVATRDEQYMKYGLDSYLWTRNTCGDHGLWNPAEGLWWRDANFDPPYKESDGQNCYWSRGNGWVYAALVRVLMDLHTMGIDFTATGSPYLILYQDFLCMSEALLDCQREDGFWNVSLLSPTTYGGPETSGTSLFLYGFAWGLRMGILSGEKYREATDRAWKAISSAVHPNGFLGFVQGTGKEPKDGQPVTADKVPDFEDYGTGCFLLAATEYYRLIQHIALPGIRWWWLGSAVTPQGITWQMEQMASHGVGALEITPLYGVQGNDTNNIEFLSPQWLRMLRHTIREGKRLGIQIDMNLGTGWPFGGPTTPIEEAACKLVVVDSIMDSRAAKKVQLEAPVREQKYAKLILQQRFKTTEKGKMRVIALFESRTRQQVKRAAPGGEGNVIDHFDSTAVAHYLQRFEDAFAEAERAEGPENLWPATFFNDSYEVYRADWTPSLLSEFEKRRGYRLQDKLQEFVDGDPAVVSDYRETLSDLLLQNFTEQWVNWCHRHGVKVRNQAHGSPANLIDVYAAVDIPEIEGFGYSELGIKGLRQDSGMTRKNQSDLTMLKYASSAAHITGKRLTSSETFTWLTEHFRTSLSQMKPDMDLMFCAGVNRMFFHGACYSPQDDPWPGWRFYASIDMSPTNTIWRDAPALMSYIQRCQERLQTGSPDNDFLVLLPIRNMWRTKPQQRLMQFEIGNMYQKSPEFVESILRIDSLGFDCDYISERYLLGTSYQEGHLQTAAGTRYAALILPGDCILSPEAQAHLDALRSQGAPIIQGIDAKKMNVVAHPEEIRSKLGLKMIRRSNPDGTYTYFISNLTSRDIMGEVSLAVGAKAGRWYNPLTDTSSPAEFIEGRLVIQLRSGESRFFLTQPAAPSEAVPSSLLNFDPMDVSFSDWKLHFIQSQPAVADTFRLEEPQTWENLGKRLSLPQHVADSLSELMGTGVYECSLELPDNISPSEEYQIDLGDVRESARLYVNGHYVGCAWCVPFTLRFQGLLHAGTNQLRIEVTNLPANRIAAYDRRGIHWRKFNEINVVDLDYKKTTYDKWSPVPSGLNSPVRLYRQHRQSNLWPDGTIIDSWFQDTTRVDPTKLGRQYVITDYGVKSDSTLVQTQAIQAVIDRASQEGGGVVVIPQGTFLSGSLFFKPGTHLHLIGRIKGSDRICDFQLLETRIEGQTRKYFAALINADGLDGFTITGSGTVDGNGYNYWQEFWYRRSFNPQCTNVDAMRPRLVYISNCQNVTVQDAHLVNSPFWTNHLYRCHHVRYLNCYIYAPTGGVFAPGDKREHGAPSSDAIDLDVCHDVLINNCYMHVNDDAVVLKGGKGTWADQKPENGPSYNILVQNCNYSDVHGCLTLGSESLHDWNVVLRNIRVNRVNRVLWLKMRPDTPQHYEKIRVENVVGNCSSFLVVHPWTQFFSPEDRPDMPVSRAHDVTFSDINVETHNFFDVRLSDKYKLSDFYFKNCNVRDEQKKFDPTMIPNTTTENLNIQ